MALSLLWRGFDPWPRSFYMPRVQPKKKERKKEKGRNVPDSVQLMWEGRKRRDQEAVFRIKGNSFIQCKSN